MKRLVRRMKNTHAPDLLNMLSSISIPDRSDIRAVTMQAPVIILPGIGGSGIEHWQTHWEAQDPSMKRFAPSVG